MGAFDDNMLEDKVERSYTRDALDALLQGESPAITETRQFGCGIKWQTGGED
jgi:hypothetical protein